MDVAVCRIVAVGQHRSCVGSPSIPSAAVIRSDDRYRPLLFSLQSNDSANARYSTFAAEDVRTVRGGTADLNGTKPRPPCWLYCSATFLRPFQVRCPQNQQDLTLCPLTELLALCPAALLDLLRRRRTRSLLVPQSLSRRLRSLHLRTALLRKKAERDNPPIGKFVVVRGVRLHYVEEGEGEPLVFAWQCRHDPGFRVERPLEQGRRKISGHRLRQAVLVTAIVLGARS